MPIFPLCLGVLIGMLLFTLLARAMVNQER